MYVRNCKEFLVVKKLCVLSYSIQNGGVQNNIFLITFFDRFVFLVLQVESAGGQLQESDSNSSLLQKIMTPASNDFDSSSLKRSKFCLLVKKLNRVPIKKWLMQYKWPMIFNCYYDVIFYRRYINMIFRSWNKVFFYSE